MLKHNGIKILTLMLLVGLTLGAQPAAPAQATPALERANAPRNVTWTGAGNDGRWSNPTNWAGQHVPGVRDHVRLTGVQSVWFDAASPIATLVLDVNFSGVLYLARPLAVTGELMIAGGQLAQGPQPIRVAALTLTGGEIVGGSGPFTVEGAAQVQAGLWTTPGNLTTARSLNIARGATVRLGANGNLILTGDGSPLTGDGLLDVMTHRPNGVEFKGNTTQDLMLASPARQFRAAGLDRQNYSPARAHSAALPGSTGVFTRTAASGPTGAENSLLSGVLDAANGYAYFGTYTYPGFVVKVDVNPTHTLARVGAITLDAGAGYLLSSAVLDAANGFAYFGAAGTSTGSIVKVDVNPTHPFARVGAITLNTGEYPSSAVLDAANGYAYFGTNTYPGKVVKVDVNPAHPFARVDAVTLNTGEDYLGSAVLDAANGFAYFSASYWPGIIVKVDVNPAHTFTRTASIMLNEGENEINSAVLDAVNGYAYFGTYYTSPGIIVKVDVNPSRTFTRTAAITLNTGEENLTSAVLDAVNGYAYFGTEWTSPGSVIKVDVNPAHTFARTAGIALSAEEYNLTSAVLDMVNGYAYFGASTDPGSVVKVDVNPAHTLARVGAVTLNAGETPLPADFDAVEDAYVDQGSAGSNYGSSSVSWFGDSKRVLVKFDLSAIPTGAHISQATLNMDYELYSHTGPSTGNPTFNMAAYRSSAPWSELSVTWNSQPSFAEAYGSTSFNSFGLVDIDVTNLVKAWVNGTYPNYGVILLGTASDSNYSAGLCPRAGGAWNCNDTSGAPYIYVSYTSIISGNAGVAGATLSYSVVGTPKTATADGTGNYTITVPSGWSGVVTPSKIGYTFSPTSRAYTVLADQTAQNYTATTAIPYTLTVNTAGTGTGNVAKNPDTPNYAAGTVVTLTASPTFTSTFGGWRGAVVTMANPLVLTMDGNKSVTATFTLPNLPPVANAGTDQMIDLASLGRLDGSGSFDPDGNLPLTYGWMQTGGAAVTFSPTVSRTTFIAPNAAGVLTFTLTVTDTGALTDTDEVVVTVKKLFKVYLPVVLRAAP